MLRLARLPRALAVNALASKRTLASSILLNDSLDNESLGNLRKQAKFHGLSSKGAKRILISRIQEYEKTHVRNTSNSSSNETYVAPGLPKLSKLSSPPAYLKVYLPDLSQPDPEPPVDVPYVPDFWDSSSASPKEAPEESLPKILVVADAETHHSGRPLDDLLGEDRENQSTVIGEVRPSTAASRSEQNKSKAGGLLDDIADDIGIPPPKDLKVAFWNLFSSR